MVHVLQIIIILFSIFALSRLILRRRDRAVPLGELIFWSIIWLGAIAIALFPELVASVANKTGFSSAIDLVIIVTVLVLFYLQFRLYVKVEQQQQDITRLVRQIALQRKKKK
ncbi:DUF2304 family protein [Candidatus Woesearchaeota archaeon]|nr:DUF2304 family protein [Candidatus Woesearchaeota archaeon]